MVKGPFDGLIGHDRVIGLLENEIAAPAHAYLFAGPSSVGKATVAHRFAAALLCDHGGQHDVPCSSCRRSISGNHPDLLAVEPDGRTALSVEQARATVAQAPMSPVEGDRKVFVFDEAGSMSEQAANALLKTLEEPTASTVFVLVVESEDDLPATIASRCRSVQFGRVREEVLVAALRLRGLGEEQAGEAARISGGRPGLALGLATNPDLASYRDVWLSVPVRVSPHPGEAFRLADEVLEAAEPLLKSLDTAPGSRGVRRLAALPAQGAPRASRSGPPAREKGAAGDGVGDPRFLVLRRRVCPIWGAGSQPRHTGNDVGDDSTRRSGGQRRASIERGHRTSGEPTSPAGVCNTVCRIDPGDLTKSAVGAGACRHAGAQHTRNIHPEARLSQSANSRNWLGRCG